MTMKRKILLSMENRFGNCETKELYCIPIMLDPRFKNKIFANLPAMGFAHELLTSKSEEMLQANQTDCKDEITPSAPKQVRKDDEMMKVHEHDRESNDYDEHSTCQKMVNTYLSEVTTPQYSNHCITGKIKRLHGLCLHT